MIILSWYTETFFCLSCRALYNIAFVRLPVIGVGIAYINNVLHGHPLIMDIGQGPTEISPIIVLSVLALILA